MAVLENLMSKVDKLLIGGGMANTFFKAEGFDVGESLVEEEYLEQARDVMRARGGDGREAAAAGGRDRRRAVRRGLAGEARFGEGRAGRAGGSWTSARRRSDVFARALQDCKTVVWNGPMGVIEMAPFAHGSHRLAAVIANLEEATTIIGGGETAAVVEQVGLQGRSSRT